MPSNVEIKACVTDMAQLKNTAGELSGTAGTLIVQEDTFFNAPNGRLKLRVLKGSPSQLIYYNRLDGKGPRLSAYHFTQVDNPEDLKETLRLSLGVRGEVKKMRLLHLFGQTRIHIDEVEGLGNYMELEVVMEEGQTVEDGKKIVDDLMAKLGILPEDLITCAYMDLLLKKEAEGGGKPHLKSLKSLQKSVCSCIIL